MSSRSHNYGSVKDDIESNNGKSTQIAIVSAKHDRRHFHANLIHYAILLIIGILYTIYGIIKYQDAINNPIIKSYDTAISSYPFPTTVACIPQRNEINSTYFDVNIIFTYDSVICMAPGCNQSFGIDPTTTHNINARNSWQIIYNVVPSYSYQCIMVIPPSNASYIDQYHVFYTYWADGLTDPDPYLLKKFNYSIPSFLSNQNEYFISHTMFHFEDFMQEITFINNNYSNIVYEALLFGQPFFAPAFSYNSVILSLEETTKINGDKIHSFQVSGADHQIAAEDYSDELCSNDVEYIDDNQICSLVDMTYLMTLKGNEYLIRNHVEYASYSWPDLLSGIGGIVSGAQWFIVSVLSLILFGFSILCITYHGLAPYPNFDDNFRERIQRLNAVNFNNK